MKKQKNKVEIYSTPSCHFCNLAKEFFKENKIEYTAWDVAADLEKRKQMMNLSEQMGVPVIVIDGKMIVGFDRAKVSELLGIK